MRSPLFHLVLLALVGAGGAAAGAGLSGSTAEFAVVANRPLTLDNQSTPLLQIGDGAALAELGTPFDDPSDDGSVVELVPPRVRGQNYSIRTVFRFTGAGTGSDPDTGIIDPSGVLFGTTYHGGIQTTPTLTGGTIFSLTPPAHGKGLWQEAVLHDFAGCTVSPCDGASPSEPLAPDGKGGFYGFTMLGGRNNAGTIFSLAKDQQDAWQENVLFSFPPPQGYQSYSGPLVDSAGNLYGSGTYGGERDAGFVFRLSPPPAAGGAWTYTKLYQFTGQQDGGHPGRLIMDPSGVLYGVGDEGGAYTAYTPGGVVFSLAPDAEGVWTETVLASTGGPSGPTGALSNLAQASNGDLYGGSLFGSGTAIDGSDEQDGTIFQLARPEPGMATTWPLTVLHGFAYCPRHCPDGQLPSDPKIQKDTKQVLILAGQTGSGGTRGAGTVFTITLKPGS